MFKKIMIILGFCFVTTDSVQARNNDNTAIIAIAVTAAAAVGTGLYWSMRESNDVKIARVDELSICYAKEMRARLSEIAALEDVTIFMSRVSEYEKEIHYFDNRIKNSYEEITARYNAWLTPWNNNVNMQRAYLTISDLAQRWSTDVQLVHQKIQDMSQRMAALHIIAYFTQVMGSWNFSTEEKDVVKMARKICQGNSFYPMHDSIEKLKNALTIVYKTRQHVFCDQTLIDKMEHLRVELLSSAAYIDETRVRKEEQRFQEELELKKRLALAEERKAEAELQKAHAATQQAKTQKNQTKIAREANRIERNRTGQKNFWLDLCDSIDNWYE